MAEKQLKIDILVDADGAVVKLKSLDDAMSRLSDRSLTKVATGISTVDKELGKLQKSFDKTAESASRQSSATDRMVGSLGKFLTVGAILGAIKKTGEWADKLDDLSQSTNLSIGFLQKLERSANLNNSSIDKLSGSVLQLEQRIGGASKGTVAAVQKLGLSFDEIRKADTEPRLRAIVLAISKIEDPAEAAAAKMALLGRSGTQDFPALLAAIQDTTEGTEDLVRAASGLENAWVKMKAAGQTLLLTIFAPMGPVLDGIASMFLKVADASARGAQIIVSNWKMAWNAIRGKFDTSGAADMESKPLPTNAPLSGGLKDGVITGSDGTILGTEDTVIGQLNGQLTVTKTRVAAVTAEAKKMAAAFTESTVAVTAMAEQLALAPQGLSSGRPQLMNESPWASIVSAVNGGFLGGKEPPGVLQNFSSLFGGGAAQTIMGALMGGGNVGQSVAGLAGNSIWQSLLGGGFGGMLSKGLTAVGGVSSTLMSSLSSFIPMIGPLIGPLISSLFGKLFGPTKAMKANDDRDAFLSQFGGAGTGVGSGFNSLAAKLTDATGEAGGGRLFQGLLAADTPEKLRSAIAAINAELDKFNAKTQEATDKEAALAAQVEETKSQFAAKTQVIKDQMASLDKEWADWDALEAPEAVMGVMERQARDRISAQKAMLEAQLQDVEAQQKAALEAVGGSIEDGFGGAVDAAQDAADRIGDIFEGRRYTIKIDYDYPDGPMGAPGYAMGGMVQPKYLAGGGPSGTDTVPAWLTPGEFVMRRSAVDRIGVGALSAMNSGASGGGGATFVVQTLDTVTMEHWLNRSSNAAAVTDAVRREVQNRTRSGIGLAGDVITGHRVARR